MTYFLSDLQIEDHFKALRRYLCMADGDFAKILCGLIIISIISTGFPWSTRVL